MSKKKQQEGETQSEPEGISNEILFESLKTLSAQVEGLKADIKAMKNLIQQYAQVRR